MPTLNWIGKDKVINHHQDVPYKVLEQQYTYSNGSETDAFESENKIIHGDNLEALKSLLPQYEGKIKCIYIDPPYNTGNEGWVYNDNVNDPKIKKWLGQVVGKESEDLSITSLPALSAKFFTLSQKLPSSNSFAMVLSSA
jgi:adenine-specific DNA-methyltransferase